ncbi:glycosyltransferase [Actinacidiphila paucisporea]|uniref:Glycosyl transferases group 1 n=1 Tax=Actinacidiphila paucisporea TaxID=310782 RepID=A0A1M7MMJ8_9ACTN|nr:glycosyltransferase [Actinacidiphila paucisporea]SHM91686.1 Glycosyl transferases group 1 [Actinacidiphila paucisporea]
MSAEGRPAPAVGFHTFRSYAGHPGRDGANFAYTEVGRLLGDSAEVRPRPHDVVELFRTDEAAREALTGCDAVVATVGPHAYLYFYLRERLGLDFRIVRDARTALWNGYLQQEWLSAPYLRPDDVLYHSSRYSLALYSMLFPGLASSRQAVCYPLLRWFPEELAGSWTGSGGATTHIGFVGRHTDDKNHSQAVDLQRELRRRAPGAFRTVAIGEGGAAGEPAVPGYTCRPPVDRARLWQDYREMDVLFFPSTSSLETFGRVLVEASFVGTPVLASTHAAASELLPAESLLPTTLRENVGFTTHLAARLGDVDVAHAADLLVAGAIPPAGRGHTHYAGHDRLLLDLIRGDVSVAPSAPTAVQQAFLDRIRMRGLDLPPDPTTADRMIGRLRHSFTALHRRGTPRHLATLAVLLARSGYRRKTASFARKSLFHGEDFTNIGGVDLQLSHLIGFEPRFTITPHRDEGGSPC